MAAEIRHPQVMQQEAAIGMRVRAHPAITHRRQFGQFGHQSTLFIEQFFGLVALHPRFEHTDVVEMGRVDD